MQEVIKAIEEMANDISNVIDEVQEGCNYTDCEECKHWEHSLEWCKSYAIAEKLYNEGYRKKPDENLVAQIVIDDEKLEKIKKDILEQIDFNIKAIKKENLMQIFYDIEQTLSQILKDLNEAKQGMTFDTLAYVNTKIAMVETIQCNLAEIKKKYTGDTI